MRDMCRISLDDLSGICYPRSISRRPIMSFLAAIKHRILGGRRSGVPAYVFL
jgi:hypothetical protein